MKSKILSMFLMTAIMCLAVVSAANFDVSISDDLTKLNTETILTVTNKDIVGITVVIPDITNLLGSEIVLDQTITGNLVVAAGSEETVTISYDELPTNLRLGDFTGEIIVKDLADTILDSKTLKLTNSYCDDGCFNEDLIDLDVEVENKEGFGQEDNEWYPFDEIEITINVDNKADDTIDDIVIEWCLYNEDEDDCIMDDEENDFNLKDNKDKDVIINFKLDADDLDKDVNDYIFYVKAYSEDTGLDAPEEEFATEYSETIKIMRDDFVILDRIEFLTETVPCNEELEFTAEVWNIGDSQEDEVLVNIYNKELEINENIIVGDINDLDNELITFNYRLPNNIEEKTYYLEAKIFDEDGDIFENEEDDEAVFLIPFTVQGNCKEEVVIPSVMITAELDDETPTAVAGKQVLVKATLRNTGDDAMNYVVTVSGHSSWSSLNSIDPQTVQLMPGESRDVSILLDVDDDAEGENEFTIKVAYNDQITEQRVALSVEIAEEELDVVAQHLKDNWFIYVIIVINIILIIAIIAVISRMVRGPAH